MTRSRSSACPRSRWHLRDPEPRDHQRRRVPLSRPLFIYVNTAKAEESDALAAFVDFYLDGVSGFVESTGYVTMPDDQVQATVDAPGRPLSGDERRHQCHGGGPGDAGAPAPPTCPAIPAGSGASGWWAGCSSRRPPGPWRSAC